MKRASLMIIAGALALGAAACGKKSDDDVSAGEAQSVTTVAWSGMWQATVSLSQKLDSQPAADAAGDAAGAYPGAVLTQGADGSSWTISGAVGNPNGNGELKIEGQATLDSSGYHATLTLTYQGWESQGLTLDGPITFTLDIAKLVPLDAGATAKGTLMVKGVIPAITVPVSVDLTATATGLDVGVCGTVAGFPVAIGTGC